MSITTNSEPACRQRALRLKMVSYTRGGTDTVASFLNSMAASIEETLSRCTDPIIVSELQYTAEKLREEAEAKDCRGEGA